MTRALVPLRVNGSEHLNLVAFSPAGMGAGAYREWAPLLADPIAFWGVRLPGRESRFHEPAPSRMAEAVAPLVGEISRLTGAIALFGHSYGALLAYAVAVELNQCAVWLGISGIGPQANEDLPGPDYPDDKLFNEMQIWGAVPADVAEHLEVVRPTLAALRADLTVARQFLPVSGPKVTCPVGLFGGSEDRGASRERLLGWRALAAGEVGLRIYPGRHFYFTDHPRAIVSDLNSSLSPRLC